MWNKTDVVGFTALGAVAVLVVVQFVRGAIKQAEEDAYYNDPNRVRWTDKNRWE